MFELGGGWQQLRQLALTAIPSGVVVPRGASQTLASWLRNGTFSVSKAEKKGFTLNASGQELGASLVADANFMLDHAAEHSVTIRNQLSAELWCSPAWQFVTFYYWGFFAAQALTRLIGCSPLWMAKDDVRALMQLASYSGNSPGSGPYEFRVSSLASVSMVDVEIFKAGKSRVHDLLWRQILELFKDFKKLATENSDEARVYGAISSTILSLGQAWPSELRNLINYSPGRGYTIVRREPQIVRCGFVEFDPSTAIENAIGRLETNVARIQKGGLQANIETACCIMVDLVLMLDSMARTLNDEIIERRNIDKRWLNARKSFFKEKFKGFHEGDWPYAA